MYFHGSPPPPQTSEISKLRRTRFLSLLWSHWYAWTCGIGKQKWMENRSYPLGKWTQNWKAILNSVIRHILSASLSSKTRFYKSKNSKDSSRSLIKFEPNGWPSRLGSRLEEQWSRWHRQRSQQEESRILGKYLIHVITSVQIICSINISWWLVTSSAIWNRLATDTIQQINCSGNITVCTQP